LIEVDIDELGRRNHYQRLSLWGRLRRWICIGGFALDVWRQRRALASLGDRELKDVGQSRSTAYREANRSILLSLPRLPLVALFGRASRANQCPVSGVKQPCRRNLETAEFDPNRSWAK
jgi:uncharacterized protein YjiS (DUF1127 family)